MEAWYENVEAGTGIGKVVLPLNHVRIRQFWSG